MKFLCIISLSLEISFWIFKTFTVYKKETKWQQEIFIYMKETEQDKKKIIPDDTFGVLISDYTSNSYLRFIAG
jgi:hypothetical protein